MLRLDKLTSVPVKEIMGIELVSEVIKRNRFRWLGYVLQKDDSN